MIPDLSTSRPLDSSTPRLRLALLLPGFCADESDWCIPVITGFVRTMSEVADVVIYTAYPHVRRSRRIHGAMVHTLSEGKPRGARRFAVWAEYRRRIMADHRERPFDLVHAFWATEPGFLATRLAASLRIPSVVSLAGGEFAKIRSAGYGAQLYPWLRWFVYHALRHATAITAGSAWIGSFASHSVRSKMKVIPLGVDTAMFPAARERCGRRLLVCASMIKLKDHPTILRAVASILPEFPDLQLDLAGDGVERPALEALVRSLGIDGVVRFLGHVRYDDMPALLADHDLLVHASLYEAEAMVVLEALATAMPVVASDVGIAASLPEDLVYRFPPGDADRLAAALRRSLGTPSHAIAAQGGPDLIAAEYSLEVVRGRFLELYRELTDGGDLRRPRPAPAEPDVV